MQPLAPAMIPGRPPASVGEMTDSGIRAGSGAASGALPWRVVKSQSLGVTGIAGVRAVGPATLAMCQGV